MSEPTDNFNAKFEAARAAFPPITRTSEGQIGPRKYKYTDLATLDSLVDPALREHGLVCRWDVTCKDGVLNVGCDVVNVETGDIGHRCLLQFPIPDDVQRFGSILTYLRRYSKAIALGVASEDDDDGAGASKQAQPARPAPRPAQAKPAQRPAPRPPAEPEHELSDDPLGPTGILTSDRPAVKQEWDKKISPERAKFFHTIAGKWAKEANLDQDLLTSDSLATLELEHASDLTNGMWRTAIWELASHAGASEEAYQEVINPPGRK